jgi:hypothetical protein
VDKGHKKWGCSIRLSRKIYGEQPVGAAMPASTTGADGIGLHGSVQDTADWWMFFLFNEHVRITAKSTSRIWLDLFQFCLETASLT